MARARPAGYEPTASASFIFSGWGSSETSFTHDSLFKLCTSRRTAEMSRSLSEEVSCSVQDMFVVFVSWLWVLFLWVIG